MDIGDSCHSMFSLIFEAQISFRTNQFFKKLGYGRIKMQWS